MRRELVIAVVVGGAIAGVLDIGAASLIHNSNPLAIMRVIAGGVLGKASMKGGAPAAGLGFALQLAMSILIAAIYAIASLMLRPLARWWLAGGLAYGVVVFLVMNYLVVPLSALASHPHFTPVRLVEELAAMLLFGGVVAFAAHWGVYNAPEKSAVGAK